MRTNLSKGSMGSLCCAVAEERAEMLKVAPSQVAVSSWYVCCLFETPPVPNHYWKSVLCCA